jgi:hypothetical protein
MWAERAGVTGHGWVDIASSLSVPRGVFASELHRRLGMFGVGLAMLVILVGMPTLINGRRTQIARRSQHSVSVDAGCV